MSKNNFTLLVIPDTHRIKAVQIDLSITMLVLIFLVFCGFLSGISYLIYDFHQSDESQNIIARNLERRQQIAALNTELELLERRMVLMVSSSIQENIRVPSPNEGLQGYQNRIEQLRLQAEIFTPILLKRVDEVNETMARSQAIPSAWPVITGFVSSNFGYRMSPISKKWRFHKGMDIAATRGTEIYAPKDGIVLISEYRSGYGNLVEIDHGYGIRTRYAHASKLLKKVGSNVKKGDIIALVGSTGNSTGPHLHYEMYIDGVAVDPKLHLGEKE